MNDNVRKRVEHHKPFIYKLNYMVYTCIVTCIMFYLYVTGYGGAMPPQGTFDDYLADFWIFITTGFLAPILSALITGYIIKKRRSTDGK
ncbi:hypothetical protein LCGC14_1204980 [marine sediment metagenome]|uniref:Uncharacterized protein n=1 Tax=marine sediment metagenome TaxID=412755 RepID=A0A0F9LK86_9ZZZZ